MWRRQWYCQNGKKKLREEVENIDNIQENKAIDDAFWTIDKVIDLIVDSKEGARKSAPHQVKQNLYNVLQSLRIERFEDS